jgi:DNA-binding SARP family transcriptional activator/TolB-like protein
MMQPIRLRTLGTLAAESTAGPLTGAATQRKPLALLAVLAAAGTRGVSREKLCSFFWPEADAERASHGLAQMLYSLRRNFGDDDLVEGTTTLSLNPASVVTDVAQFERAFADGDLESAVAIYQGPFLEGVYLKDAPVFERWAEEERSRLAERYRSALEGLAIQAASRGDHETAIARWRQVAAVDPLGTRAALGLMRALTVAGDRAGALQHAHIHETLVRQELDTDPDPAITALCAELRDGRSPGSGMAAPGDAVRGRSEPLNSIPEPARLPPAPAADPPLTAEAPAAAPSSSGRQWSSRLVLAGVVLALLAGTMWSMRRPDRSEPGAGLDANRIVILPFRVTSADSSLSYLSEGLVDLLATTLTGEGGPVAVDPRTTLALWRQVTSARRDRASTNAGEGAGLQVAQASGAGLVLRGEIVRTSAARLVLSGAVVGVADGRTRARATVQGEGDSIPALVDRLAAQLLALAAGEGVQHLPALTSTSLPALRAYLEGRAAHHRGDDGGAVAHFSRALQLDSTFALAGLELAAAAGPVFKWTVGVDSSWIVRSQRTAMGGILLDDDERVTWALNRAWQGRDRLSEPDRAYLVALRGENYPHETSAARLLAGWERATRAAPDRADAWYQLGYILLTQGASLGLAGARDRAASVFRRARELDPGLVAPITGLLEIAAFARNRDEVRRLGALYLAGDSVSERAQYIRWRVATIVGDSIALRGLRSRFGDFGLATLDGIQRTSQLDGIALEDAERATAVLLRRAAGREQRRSALFTASQLALNRGRPREALRQLKLKLEVEGTPNVYLNQCINFALHWEGDSSAGADAAREWETIVQRGRTLPNPTSFQRRGGIRGLWPVARWRLWHGDTATAARLLLLLRSASPADTFSGHAVRTAMLDAEVAVVARRPNALALVDHLDALAREGCCSPAHLNLVVARLREMTGDVPGALRAVRRGAWSSPWFLSTYLREEGRLAALTGDREGAIRAYRHFLMLRSDPEPSLATETEDVRRELHRLEQRAN